MVLGVSHETTSISFFLQSAFGCCEDQVQGEQVTRLLEASVAMVAGELEELASR